MASVDILVNVITKLEDKGIASAQSKFGKVGAGLQKALVPAAAATGAIVAFGVAAVQSASRLEQAMGATDSVFGRNASVVKRWADDSANSVGLAKSEYLELSNVLGAQLKGMGIPMDKVAGKTRNLTKMGADLAATFGGTTAEAVGAIGSLLRGEADPIEQYGVSIKQADIAARLAAKGQDELKGAALKTASAQAALDLLTKKTTDSQGAFARESDTAAHAQQVAAAQYEDTKAALGESLLPVMTKVMDALSKFSEWAQKNPALIQVVAGGILALAAAVAVLNVAMLIASATPLVLIITGIVIAVGLLAAGIVILVKKFGGFKAVGTAVLNAIKSAFNSTKDAAAKAWNGIVNAAKVAWNWIKGVWKGVKDAITKPISDAVAFAIGLWNDLKAGAETAFNAVKGIVSSVGSAIKAAWTTVVNALVTAVTGIVSRVRAAFDRVKAAVMAVFNGAKSWLTGVGHDIVAGLVDGINSVIGWVQNAVQALADKIPGWVKKRLGIASPSTVMAAIGNEVSLGLAMGIEAEQSAVQKAATNIAALVNDEVLKTISAEMEKEAVAKAAKRREGETTKEYKQNVKERIAAAKSESAAWRKVAAAQAATVTAAISAQYADEAAALDAVNARREELVTLLDEARKAASAAADEMANYAASLRDAAIAYGGITGVKLPDETEMNAGNLAAAMQERVTAVQEFADRLDRLRAAGLAESIIQEMARAGVEGAGAQAAAIEAGGTAAIAQFNALATQLNAAATQLGNSTATAMYGAGVAATQALVDSLVLSQAQAESLAATLAAQLAAAIQAALEAALDEVARNQKGKGRGKGNNNRSAAPSVAASTVAPTVRGGRAARTAAPGTTTVINVTGAIDPEATARQIRRILKGHDRRVGLVT